jgi:hypothetical protein
MRLNRNLTLLAAVALVLSLNCSHAREEAKAPTSSDLPLEAISVSALCTRSSYEKMAPPLTLALHMPSARVVTNQVTTSITSRRSQN